MNRTYVISVVAIAAIAAVFFYRYDYHPSEVRKYCEAKAKQDATIALKEKSKIDGKYIDSASKDFYMYSDYETMYKQCLRSQGFEAQDMK